MDYVKTTHLPRCLRQGTQSCSGSPRRLPSRREYVFDSPTHRTRTSSVPKTFCRINSTEELYMETATGIEYYRLRSFSVTQHGVYNMGDTFKRKSDTPDTSTGEDEGAAALVPSSTSQARTSAPKKSDKKIRKYSVVMIGAPGVGKSALCQQFMTSEYVCPYVTSQATSKEGMKTVHVMFNGEEIELIVVDVPPDELTLDALLDIYQPQTVVVVYSVVSTLSLEVAEQLLLCLGDVDMMPKSTIILVGSHADLERTRVVSTSEGRELATSWQCKFIETSSGVVHNVDELLVGILAQSTLSEDRRKTHDIGEQRNTLHCGTRFLMSLLNIRRRTRSCENLLTK